MGRGGHHRTKKTHTLLIKGGDKTYYRNKVVVDFSPPNASFVPPQMAALVPIPLPQFNTDQRTFTPGFMLRGAEVDEQHYMEKHQKKIRQHDEIDSEQMMQPKPRNKDYCNVCERHFADYREHILSEIHHQILNNNSYQRKIRRLCRKWRKKHFPQQQGLSGGSSDQRERRESFGEATVVTVKTSEGEKPTEKVCD